MIDELLNYGIKKETIDSIKDNPTIEYNLSVNIKDVKDIIIYLASLNINNIDNILLYDPDLFIETKKDIEERFNKKNIIELVNLINDDYENIDLLYE